MKKYLPFIILGIGVLILIGGFLFIKSRNKPVVEEEETVAEIPFEKRPFTSLTPSEDGHWLKLNVENIVFEATTLDYELLYKLPDGRTQGVPGSVKLAGQKEFERDLLLGSESSGKFRYDEGVTEGTLTLRFRNEKGKLTGKLSTDFHLQSEVDELTSVDGSFSFEFEKASKEGYFVTMNTFGIIGTLPGTLAKGPYGVFGSATDDLPGMVRLEGTSIYNYTSGDWNKLEEGETDNIGIFISTSE